MMQKSESNIRESDIFSSLSVACLTTDRDGNILFCNPAFTGLTGYANDEFLKQRLNIFRDRIILKEITPDMQEAVMSGTQREERVHCLTKEGRAIESYIIISPLKDEHGTASGATMLFMDNSAHLNKEKELTQKINELEGFINTNPDIFYVIDTEGKLKKWNRGVEELTGLRHEELLNKPATDFVVEEDRDNLHKEILKVFQTGFNTIEARFITREGGSVPYLCNGAALKNEFGEIIGFTGSGRDISDRIEMEKKQKETQFRQQQLNNLQEYLLGTDELETKLKTTTDYIVKVFDCDFCRIWMIRPGDLCQGCMHLREDSAERCKSQEHCLHLLASSGRYTHTNGGHQRVPLGCYKIGRLATGSRSNFLSNNVTVDPHIHNHEWAKSLGLKSFAGFKLKDSRSKTRGVLALFSKHEITPEEDALLMSLGNSIAQVVKTSTAEEAIKRSLKEKEILLGEIHHRVKNNMQIISSLLKLQSMAIKDETYLSMIEDSQNRIRTMALIHEKLYQSDDMAHIYFREYTEELTRYISECYEDSTGHVSIHIDTQDLQLSLNTAIPLGLIINELVSNSMKYAFKERNRGIIDISLRRSDERSMLFTYRDNGTGLPDGFDLHNTDTLGLQLVSTLAENQLEGRLEVTHGDGAEFKIAFIEQI